MNARPVVASLALVLVSCKGADSKPSDSAMARDLALANQSSAEPQLKDTALSTATRPATPPRSKTVTPRVPPPVAQPVEAPTNTTPAADTSSALPAKTAPAPFRGIPAGATFSLTTKAGICTTNLPGDKITATITADVQGESGAMIPAGSTVVLEVQQVTPGDTPEHAAITLRIRSVIVNDQPVTVPSDVAVTSQLERRTVPRDKGSDRKKVIGGVVAGAIVGQILGKDTRSTITGAVVGGAAGAAAAAATGTKYDACLPAGGTLRATTREAVPLTSSQ